MLEISEIKDYNETTKSGGGYKVPNKHKKPVPKVESPPVDENMLRYEETLRGYGIIGKDQKFDPSKVT